MNENQINIKPIIKIVDLYKSFKKNEVLRGLTLDVFPGEVLCVIGQSGSGKSVLVKHITNLLDQDSGSIFYMDQDISKFNKKKIFSLRKDVSMLFQSGALFDSMDVFENLALPLQEHTNYSTDEIRKLVAEKLTMVGMRGVERLAPSELSGGMRKRVGLARSIILEPKVIMYDEPTTGLDPIMSDVINKLVIDLNKRLKITSIVITHDMNSVYTIADRVAMIFEGKIIFNGSVQELKDSEMKEVQDFIHGKSE